MKTTLELIEETLTLLETPLTQTGEPDALFRRTLETQTGVRITLERIVD